MPLVPQHFAPTDETRSTADRLLVAELALVALRTVDRDFAEVSKPQRPALTWIRASGRTRCSSPQPVNSVVAGFAMRGSLPDLVSRLRNDLVRADATVMRVASTLWAAALLAGCSPGWTSGGELRDGAFSLVPPRSSIVEEVAADCVELAPSPSCVHLYFLAPPTPLERRTRLVEAAAATSGWERVRLEAFPGGNIAHYRRGDFDARVYLRPDEVTGRCRRRPHKDCADAIMVE